MKAIYAGTFDPITKGHMDIIMKAATIFDEVIVVVACNIHKQTLFSKEERIMLIKDSIQHLSNVSVDSCDNAIIYYAQEKQASVLIRGVRQVKDFEYEQIQAYCNEAIDSTIQTILLYANTQYAHVSSSMVKELAMFHLPITSYVSDAVATALLDKYPICKLK